MRMTAYIVTISLFATIQSNFLVHAQTESNTADDTNTIQLDESKLKTLLQDESVPTINDIKATLLQSQYQNGVAQDSLIPSFYFGHNDLTTKEKPTMSFNPVFNDIKQYQAGLKKNLAYGVQLDASITTDSRSSDSSTTEYKNLTTTTYALQVNLDLWKDLFGKLTRKKLSNAQMMSEQAKLQSDISLKTFEVTLRRVYWSLVANNEKRIITKSLHQTALKQAKQAKLRLANSIADKGEVARYESQVAARKGSMLLLNYEKEGLLKQLRSFLPSLNGKTISLGKYSLNKTIFQVLECTSLIEKSKSVPYAFTKYDELTSILRSVQRNQKSIDEAYSGIDISLSTKFKRVGVGSDPVNSNLVEGSFDESITDLNDNDRSGLEAGLMINIPLGFETKTTEDVLIELNKRKMQARIDNVDTNLLATHQQISRSIKILSQVIATQKINSEKLQIRLKSMQKKYQQARIPVSAMILDQDALLSSDLSIVDTQLAILNTLLDYFVVFSDTPCAFNKI